MITVHQFVSRFLDKNSLVATLILLSGSPYLEKFAGSELNLSFFCVESFSTGINFGLLRYWMAFSLIIWLYSELEVPEWQFWSGFHITLGSNGSISAFFSILGWGYKSSFATKLIPISRNCRIWGHSSFRDRHIFSIRKGQLFSTQVFFCHLNQTQAKRNGLKFGGTYQYLTSKQLMSIKNVKTITINTSFSKIILRKAYSLKKKWVGQIQANLSFPHIFRRAWCFIVF